MRPLLRALLGSALLAAAACGPADQPAALRHAGPGPVADVAPAAPAVGAPPGSAGLLFALDYDDWAVSANPAKGGGACTGFGSHDLQLRMFNGIKGKGGALKMANGEYCQYALPGNFDVRQGTISLWVSPQSWKGSDDRFQILLTAQDQNWRMIVYKYYQEANLLFYLEVRKPDGSFTRYSASAKANDTDWHPGVWRKIDATWDLTQGMHLYVDGRRPVGTVGSCDVEFKTPVALPAPGPEGRLIIGGDPQWRVNPHWNKDDETAFDNVRIYDRQLSANEIQAEYQRYFPSDFGVVPASNRLTIPLTAAAVTLDGSIGEAEWAAASRVPVMEFRSDSPHPAGLRSWAWLSHTADALQIALRSEAKAPYRAAIRARDGQVWEDDSFELFLVAPGRTGPAHHLIVNANGALFDEKDGTFAWNSRTQAKASQDAGGWSVELSIPLADLGASAGEAWRGNIFSTYHIGNGSSLSGWSLPSTAYKDAENYGTLVFGTDATAVRIEEVGQPAGGRLALRPTAFPDKLAVSASYEVDGGELVPYPGNLAGRSWTTSLPSGRQKLVVDAGPAFHYEHAYYVSQPLELSYACFPGKGYIEVQCDAGSAGEAMAAALKAGTVAGKAALTVKADGRLVSEAAFAPRALRSPVRLALPADLPPGEYEISATLTPASGEAISRVERIRVPDLSIYRNPPVTDHQVPPPWTPVVAEGKGVFTIWGRRYAYDGGPFPARISSGGAEILSAPIELLVDLDGTPQPVRWSGAVQGESHADVVTMSGSGTVGEGGRLRVDWRTRLYFDGVSRTEFTLAGPAPVTVKGLSLRYGLSTGCARYVLTPLHTPWQDGRLDLAFDPVPNQMKDFSLWVTGDDRGLFWWPESNANWVGEKGAKQIHLARSAQGVAVDIAIIARPVELKAPASYAMVFMGSPARPLPADARTFHDSGWGTVKGQTHQSISWGSFSDKAFPDDCTDFVGLRPRDPAAFAAHVEEWRAKGVAPLPYGQPTYLTTLEPEYDFFAKTWEQYPARTFDGTKLGVRYKAFPCCPNSQFADYIVHRAVDMMDAQPRIGGLYYDLCWVSYCENPEHGCGGTDAFGQPFMTSSAWGMRSGMMRIYTAAHARGKIVMNHNHNLFNPIAHNFTDEWYPGEQYEGQIAQSPDPSWFYCEGIPMEAYQSELSMRIKGVGISFLPQFLRAVEMNPSLKAKGGFDTDEYTIRTLTPLVLHDVPVSASWMKVGPVGTLWAAGMRTGIDAAAFTGYWRNTAVTADSAVPRISYYAWPKPSPYRLMLVAGNTTREPAAFALTVDRRALGLGAGPLQAEDAQTQRPLATGADRITGLVLAGNHFQLIGIR